MFLRDWKCNPCRSGKHLMPYGMISLKISVVLLFLGAFLRFDISGGELDTLEKTITRVGRIIIGLGYGVFVVSVGLFLLAWQKGRNSEK